ncbi:hypothetical protein A9K75_08630 [Campylobacter fetus subsp. testudinum]|uniref:hypothetical protein n=1 Tax=Campylobacter fetus TaxID=196 RepID=UPI0008187F37|nr:hypothetical protein [Campylobacter fetus]OCR99067.1 hypothetical protein A9K75_08630 [Campylobacter fetus subsp. testudinum]
MYCENKENKYFICDVCGSGMCDSCYDSDAEYDCHYYQPLENCDDDREIELVTKACGGYEPEYICEDCLTRILAEIK